MIKPKISDKHKSMINNRLYLNNGPFLCGLIGQLKNIPFGVMVGHLKIHKCQLEVLKGSGRWTNYCFLMLWFRSTYLKQKNVHYLVKKKKLNVTPSRMVPVLQDWPWSSEGLTSFSVCNVMIENKFVIEIEGPGVAHNENC